MLTLKIRDFIQRERFLTHILLIIASIVMLYPLLWMLSSSFKPEGVIFAEKGLIPTEVTMRNYIHGWNALSVPFSRFFLNSFLISIGSVIGNVLSCSITAYAFARLDFRFKRIAFAMMLMTIMLPSQVTLIPQYVLFDQLEWVNSMRPLIVPHFFAVDSFFIFLMVQFIRGVPKELDDAAMVDGANKFQIFYSIILPLMTPALITTAIFTFIWQWNNFLGQLIYLNNVELFTVPLALRTFLDASGRSSFGPMLAMSVLALVPSFVFFIGAQRYLVQGIATTGFKG